MHTADLRRSVRARPSRTRGTVRTHLSTKSNPCPSGASPRAMAVARQRSRPMGSPAARQGNSGLLLVLHEPPSAPPERPHRSPITLPALPTRSQDPSAAAPARLHFRPRGLCALLAACTPYGIGARVPELSSLSAAFVCPHPLL